MEEYIEKIKERLRIVSDAFNDEIRALADACMKDMELSGIYGEISNPLYFQAIVLYEKAYFGAGDDTEKMQKAYEALKVSMSLAGGYYGQKQDSEADQPGVQTG